MDHNPPELESRPGADKLLRAEDLEAWLGVSRKTIYSWKERGLLPYVQLESAVRFRRKDIDEWLERRSYRPRKKQ
jgi:excisionase family DNA binding protein